MFSWSSANKFANHGNNYDNYTIENDGHFLAIQEAYADLASIDGKMAGMNAVLCEAYAKDGDVGVQKITNNKALMEGFFGDLKENLIKLLTKLKEKIVAFFNSAIKYFDAHFKSEYEFASKYEDEIGDKDLEKFKFSMFEWNISTPDKDWKAAKDAAEKKGKSLKLFESYSYNRINPIIYMTNVLLEEIEGNMFSTKEANFYRNVYNIVSTLLSKLHSQFYIEKEGAKRLIEEGEQYQKLLSFATDYEHKISDPNFKYNDSIESIKNTIDDWGRRVGEFFEKYNDEVAAEKARRLEEIARAGREAREAREKSGNSSNDSSSNGNSSTKSTRNKITSANRKEIAKAVYTEILGSAVSSAENFKKELKKKYRGGRTEPKEIEPDMNKVIDGLKNHKEDLTAVQDARSDAEDAFDTLIDEVKTKKEGVTDKQSDEFVALDNKIKCFTEAKNAFMITFGIWKEAVEERGTQYRKCLSAALHYSKDED